MLQKTISHSRQSDQKSRGQDNPSEPGRDIYGASDVTIERGNVSIGRLSDVADWPAEDSVQYYILYVSCTNFPLKAARHAWLLESKSEPDDRVGGHRAITQADQLVKPIVPLGGLWVLTDGKFKAQTTAGKTCDDRSCNVFVHALF